MTVKIIEGDALAMLRTLPDKTFQMCVTSPPYFGLRDYGVEGQMGLEATPDAYVAGMVAVFAEVRRVLRDDGTLWLNIGDSYCSTAPGTRNAPQTKGSATDPEQWANPRPKTPIGMKPKDLIGIPWMLAKALQAPRYTGRIKSLEDRVWLAAMIDAEGCMFIHRRKAGTDSGSTFQKADGTISRYARTQDTFGSGLEVANTSLAIVEKCIAITGLGSVCSQSPTQNNRRKQTIYRWNLRTNECRDVVREIYPHLVAKQQQARLLIACPPSGERAAAAHQAMIDLHNGVPTTVDFPEPESMFEQGWFLRQDIIWSKLNPMPESIADRCTKAHEYVFLLTKRPTYFYDQEAIAEEVSPNTHARLSQNVQSQIGSDRAHAGGKTNGRMKAVGRKFDPGAGNKNNPSFDAAMEIMPSQRNARSVWTIATEPFKEAHFATMPTKLALRCVLAGSSERGQCPSCGAPWARILRKIPMVLERSERTHSMGQTRASGTMVSPPSSETIGWAPTCKCPMAEPVPQHVLDPFGGAGTTALVADRKGRDATIIELNPASIDIARRRITGDSPLFAEVEHAAPQQG